MITVANGNRIWVSDRYGGMDVFDLQGRRLAHSRADSISAAALSDGRVVYAINHGTGRHPDMRVQVGSPDGPKAEDPQLNVSGPLHVLAAISGTTQVVIVRSEGEYRERDLCDVALNTCRLLSNDSGYSTLGVLKTPIVRNSG